MTAFNEQVEEITKKTNSNVANLLEIKDSFHKMQKNLVSAD